MTVSLEAIQFNHDPRCACRDAFSIRKNETEAITVPEWQKCVGVNCINFPAAYARDEIKGDITIKAKFSCDIPDLASVQVKAIDGHPQDVTGEAGSTTAPLTNVLGVVIQNEVVFTNGESEFVPFRLHDLRIGDVGVSVSEVIWQWQFCPDSQNCADPQSWTDFARTEHKIYTVLALPKDPWKPLSQDPNETQLPWTDVLDVTFDWAGSAQNIDEAAARITHKLNDLGGSSLQYDEAASGSSHFIYPGTGNFQCSPFLACVARRDERIAFINCSDCATVVSSFSNVLGCDLSQSKMGFDFATNPTLLIGLLRRSRPIFNYHEVAWKFGCLNADPLFDACLHVDGDIDPTTDDHDQFVPLLGVNVPLGDPTDTHYHFRLAAHNNKGKKCRARPRNKVRRRIGFSAVIRRRGDPDLIRILSKRYDYPDWENTRTSEQNILVWRYSLNSERFLPKGWRLSDIKKLWGEPGTFDLIDALWSSADENFDGQSRAVVYECASLRAAHSFLLDLLAEFQLTTIVRSNDVITDSDRVTLGDVSFAGPKKLTVLFARANLIVLLRNVNTRVTPLSQVAAEIDIDIISDPQETGEKVDDMNRFAFPDRKFRVGDVVPIEISHPNSEEAEPLYKFFSSSGELFFQEGQLSYRPAIAGVQHVTAFEFKIGQATSRQRLTLNVESAPMDSYRE